MIGVRTSTLALGLALVAGPADVPRFAPAAKSSLVKIVTTELVLTTPSPVMEIDGVRVRPERNPPPPGREQTLRRRAVLHDRWLHVGLGRPLELDRTYDELVHHTTTRTLGVDGTVDASVPAVEAALESDLEGATIRFVWNPASATYDASAAAGHEIAVETLAGLREDVDLRALLPRTDVALGDEWPIDPRALWTLAQILGDVPFHPAGERNAPVNAPKFDAGDDVTGEARARYASVREIDGHRLASLPIQAKLSADRKVDGVSGGHVAITWEFEGKLVWDLTAQHVHGCDLTGRSRVETALDKTVESNGASHVVRTISRAEGRFQFTLETRAP